MMLKQMNLRRISAGLLLLLAACVMGWVTACSSATAVSQSGQAQLNTAYTFYLGAAIGDEAAGELVPLDPDSLEEEPDGKRLDAGMFSADGSIGVDMEYPAGRSSLDVEDSWIFVYDLESGAERNRFNPPVSGLVIDLSEDGARLLLQPFPFPSSTYPPTVEWYVVESSNGETVAHIEDADNACFRQNAILDPGGQFIYCLLDPAMTKEDGPEPVQIVQYSVENGRKERAVELPAVRIGGAGFERDGQPVEELLEPAVALSPDGERLVVVHADEEKITVLDAHDLAIERSFSLARPVGWGRLFAPAVAHAKGALSGTIRQATFSQAGSYLYVYTQEVRMVEGQEPPEKRGLWLVDLEEGVITGEALSAYQIQWVQPAPDGTLFVFGTTDDDLLPFEVRPTSPSMLLHLDGETLEVLAERSFTGFRAGRLAAAVGHPE